MDANKENEEFFLKLVEDGKLIIRDDGSIFNAKTLKLYDRTGPGGHIHIAAKDRGKTRHIMAHRLVYLAKKGPLCPSDDVIHKDCNRSNNVPANLIRTNASGTLLHAMVSGERDMAVLSKSMLSFYDENLHHGCKLGQGQVIEIRQRFAAGESKKKLAKAFNIDRKAIIRIVRGDSYRAVPPAQKTELETL